MTDKAKLVTFVVINPHSLQIHNLVLDSLLEAAFWHFDDIGSEIIHNQTRECIEIVRLKRRTLPPLSSHQKYGHKSIETCCFR
ncbi:hypothetical protein OnM2_087053 [Erysiphe neolycopersici]|uniref:Uncharacterized protein n=1 Tax=Erysiphe neolycopersici TaxID=212602 RepID=A0A420HEB0_9PEZI|nr:hypothetical protein OnM2_087053 [Erysiphe neolycopersici]